MLGNVYQVEDNKLLRGCLNIAYRTTSEYFNTVKTYVTINSSHS